MSLTPRFLISVSTLIQNFAPFATGPGPEAEDVFLAGQRDADRRIDRPVGDLAVTDLDHDCIDEDRRIHLVQRPVLPLVHLFDDFVF